jgi:hypothetical protein
MGGVKGWMFGHALATKSLWVFLTQDSLWRKILIDKYISPAIWWIGFNKGIKQHQMLHLNGGLSL